MSNVNKYSDYLQKQGCSDNAGGIDTHKLILKTLNVMSCLLWHSQSLYTEQESQIKNMQLVWGALRTIVTCGEESIAGAKVGNIDNPYIHMIRASFPKSDKDDNNDAERLWKLPLAIVSYLSPGGSIQNLQPFIDSTKMNAKKSLSPGHIICKVKNPDLEKVRAVFEARPQLAEVKNITCELPIHVAASFTQSKELIKYLVRLNRTCLSARSSSDQDGGCTPFLSAVKHNESPISILQAFAAIKPLLFHNVDNMSNNAMHIAVSRGDLSVEAQLSLCHYIRMEDRELVKAVNNIGYTPLHTCRRGEIASLLIQWYPEALRMSGVDGHLPIHSTAKNSTLSVFKVIAEADPSCLMEIVPNTGSPLHICALRNDSSGSEIAEYVCKYFPDIARVPNNKGALPLHIFASLTPPSFGFRYPTHFHTLRTVCLAYPDAIGIPDLDMKLPLHHACASLDAVYMFHGVWRAAYASIIRYLVYRYPGSVSAVDVDGQTPFSCVPSSRALNDIHRVMLRMSPSLDLYMYRTLNYENRRLALLVAFWSSKSAQGRVFSSCRWGSGSGGICCKEPILQVLAREQTDMFREVLSFL